MRYQQKLSKFFKKFCYACVAVLLVLTAFAQLNSEESKRHFYGNTQISRALVDKLVAKHSNSNRNATKFSNASNSNMSRKSKYYVISSKCKMPYVNPFTPELMEVYTPRSYINCTNDGEDIVTVAFNATSLQYTLHIDYEVGRQLLNYTNYDDDDDAEDFFCCYKEIIRVNSDDSAEGIRILYCTDFLDGQLVPLHIDGMLIECRSQRNTSYLLQESAFAFVQKRNFNITEEHISNSDSAKERKPNVLMIGIDSMSRINLRRTMPETYAYLKYNKWYEMQGYNKMGDNTFPNLMAVLTGYNESATIDVCQPNTVGGLDACPFIWKQFKNAGYITAYGEDEYTMATFNYFKKGFLEPPVDYYLRPFMIAAQYYLKECKAFNLHLCLGRHKSSFYVYDYAAQLATMFTEQPSFGLFWSNSFSHDYFDMPSAMDLEILAYFENLEAAGILHNSIVILFSDHGMRWGQLLELPEGFLEERLPMLFIWLPLWFRKKYPDYAHALRLNRNRLTSPYDLHMTLRHIIELADVQASYASATADGCEKCQSLLLPVPENRSCDDAGILEHWCTCIPYAIVTNQTFKENITNLVIDSMNAYLELKNLTSLCSNISFNSTQLVEKKLSLSENGETITETDTTTVYRVKFTTNPNGGIFQATLLYDELTDSIEMDVESISRLNTYVNDSQCIDQKEAKKYCFCVK